jgi:RNA polymerase sigma factor (sigma-70 family)
LIRQPLQMTNAVTITRMAQEQNDSIKEVVEEHGNRLFNFIRNRVSDLEDAQDILQDVFYEFTETSRLPQPIEQASSWLFRVARNKIIDKYRKKKTERLDDLYAFDHSGESEKYFLSDLISANTDTPGNQFDNTLLMLAIEEALEELPKEQREVFIMHELEDKSFREISELTHIPLNTLLSRKRYAVVHLRKKLTGLYNEMFN